MSAAAYIAGDWGTSNLRLFLCADDDRVLETINGPGAVDSRGRFAEVFDGLTAAWHGKNGRLPAILCGMAGSAFGWVEAPYLLCPEDVVNIATTLASPRADVHIIPGMRCSNPLGAPDVLRGEETQLLGALAQVPALAEGRHLVCLPGTHTKWVSLHDGVVLDFLTVPTGELFRLLCDHSVLVRDPATPVEHRGAEFERGLAEAVRHGSVSVLHRLFQGRSLRIDKQLSPEGAPSWVSGLLIGADVGGALPLFGAHGTGSGVHVVGTPALCALYRMALARHGRHAECIAGDAASLAGLARVRATMTGN
jgi:2-dehydro-3-deoxygalactonokinase